MKPKQGLQKLTKSDAELDKIFQLEQINTKDIEHLNKPEWERLMELSNQRIQKLSGAELDQFYTKIEPLLAESSKNQIWESNHIKITWAISNLIRDFGRMPTKTEISIKAELSRQTIHKHMSEHLKHPQYMEQMEQFRFMASSVLAKVYEFAVSGDTGAAKLYLNATGFLNNGQSPNNTLIKNQNNYIQINGMVLSQEVIKNLNPDQLASIESILKKVVPKSTPE